MADVLASSDVPPSSGVLASSDVAGISVTLETSAVGITDDPAPTESVAEGEGVPLALLSGGDKTVEVGAGVLPLGLLLLASGVPVLLPDELVASVAVLGAVALGWAPSPGAGACVSQPMDALAHALRASHS